MIEEIFRKLSSVLPGYESRESQVRLAHLVSEAMRNRQHAAFEAPTGVGKSLAYLAGSLPQARQKRVLISTNSLTLQSQLLQKDVPLLNLALDLKVRATTLKGRTHYICLERLDHYYNKYRDKEPMFGKLHDLAIDKNIGEDEQYDFLVPSEVWTKVICESHSCLREQCSHFANCFYYLAKQEAERSNFVIVNHHLFLLDRQIRQSIGKSILPDYECVVLDEAHEIQDIASDVFGKKLTLGRVKRLLHDILSFQGQGVLARFRKIDTVKGAFGFVRDEILELSEEFFRNVKPTIRTSLLELSSFPDSSLLIEKFQEVANLLSDLPATDEVEYRLQSRAIDRVLELIRDFQEITTLADREKKVYYADVRNDRVDLFATPIVVSDLLKFFVWESISSVVCTSATLAAAGDFLYFQRETGFYGHTGIFESPFNFRNQVCRYISDVPYNTTYERESTKRYEQDITREIERLLNRTGGRALVLFTNRETMLRVYDSLKHMRFGKSEIMCQGNQIPRDEMIKRFKEDEQSVIFGLKSFSQGIDVKGRALSQVIIVKLPFDHIDDPVVNARIQRCGSRAFMDYSVPKAIIQFKQSFGRLIRSKSDYGIFSILDSRVKTSRWGSRFLNSIPLCSELDQNLKVRKI
jgi:ATP-dependent DNA helicase DinG